MSKRILIVCEAIEAPAYSPRVMSIVRYLVQQGWDCHLLTESSIEGPYETDLCPIHTMPHYTCWLADKVLNGREKQLYRFACKELKMQNFDLIFCSTYYYFPLQTAHRLAKKWNIPLITDLRDIREQWGENGFYTHSIPCQWLDTLSKKWFDNHNLKLRNRVLKDAVAVTTVSPWHRDTLAQINPNCYCIYNGFDEEELQPQDVPTDKFRIIYLGQIHSLKKRNPEILFKALSPIIKQLPELIVDFYIGKSFEEDIRKMGETYHIPLSIREFIPRAELASKMQEASILLLLSSADGTHGIMTTKFFEAIGVEKPLLSISPREGCLADAIRHTQVGISTTEEDEIQSFVMQRYTDWKEKGYTRQLIIDKKLFTRANEAKQFEDLFRHSAHL